MEAPGAWQESEWPKNPLVPRSRKKTKAGRYTSDITLEELSQYFHMPTEKACQHLGVGLTILKRLCRKFGLPRWPYRKLSKGTHLTGDAIGHNSGAGNATAMQQQQQQQHVAPPPHLLTSGLMASGLATEDSGMVAANSDAHALSCGNTSSEPVATVAPEAGAPAATLAGINALDGSLPSLPTSVRGSQAPVSAEQLQQLQQQQQQQAEQQQPVELKSAAAVARPNVCCSSPSKLDVLLRAIEKEVPTDAAADGREGRTSPTSVTAFPQPSHPATSDSFAGFRPLGPAAGSGCLGTPLQSGLLTNGSSNFSSMHSWAMPGQGAVLPPPAAAAPLPAVDAAQLASLLLSQPALAQQLLCALTSTLTAERPAAAPRPPQQLGHALGHSARSAFQPLPSSSAPPLQLPAAAAPPDAPPQQLAGQAGAQLDHPALRNSGLATAVQSVPGLSETQRARLMQELGAQMAGLPAQGGGGGGSLPAPAASSGVSAAMASLRSLLAQLPASSRRA